MRRNHARIVDQPQLFDSLWSCCSRPREPLSIALILAPNMEVGMCHPPVGLNLYVASGITKMGITELSIPVWPWLVTMLVFLAIVTYWPPLSIWLLRVLGMM